ncbi:hypothetical protein HPB48_007288 [Haemaphysalis longicornis]|uniref:Prolyl 4-hydroxylase N-terminal domain-containing protein n=1 Tax=Haemaphysalis longicornis TaxID=44386 RepID=A0A9J6FCM5_HAELO|nr:hypothetical protein HPB48_007288 [Haemaphysalis longicornis]
MCGALVETIAHIVLECAQLLPRHAEGTILAVVLGFFHQSEEADDDPEENSSTRVTRRRLTQCVTFDPITLDCRGPLKAGRGLKVYALLAIACIALLPPCYNGQLQRDFYSSVHNLLSLVKQEQDVRLMLLAYAERLKTLQANIVKVKAAVPRLAESFRSERLSEAPGTAFHLTKRMIVDLGSIESQIHELHASDPLHNITAMRTNRLLPWDEDFNGIASSLVRLQDTYLLDMDDLISGHLTPSTVTSGPQKNRRCTVAFL